jgi:phage shock protein A
MWPFKRKAKTEKPRPVSPLQVFDEVIGSLEKQATEARRSAATLLALRGELKREVDKYESRKQNSAARVLLAKAANDAKALRVLEEDTKTAERNLVKTQEAFALATRDSERLVQAAGAIQKQLAELKEERRSAQARLHLGLEVSATLKQQADDFERLMKLDRARDEVERAHALAELYREGR